MSRYMGGQTTAVAERSGLTNDEIEELSEAFKLFDTEGTGTLCLLY
jgi:Ca2+-binding EF-hand superfamily protein